MTYIPNSATAPATFDLFAYNSNGNGTTTKYYCYASAAGGSIVSRTSTLPTAYSDTCPRHLLGRSTTRSIRCCHCSPESSTPASGEGS